MRHPPRDIEWETVLLLVTIAVAALGILFLSGCLDSQSERTIDPKTFGERCVELVEYVGRQRDECLELARRAADDLQQCLGGKVGP